MSKPRQPLLPTFTVERIIVRKIVPHTRRGVVLRFRVRTQIQYRVRWSQMAEVKEEGGGECLPPAIATQVVSDKE